MEDRWLSVDEITEYLGVSRDTVYNWIATREMPAHRVGRLWKFKKEAVDAWVQSGGADAAEPASVAEDHPAADRVGPAPGGKKARTKTGGRKSR
jgi:excisionase family DNA binding protein